MGYKFFGRCWGVNDLEATEGNNGKDEKVMELVIFNKKTRKFYRDLENQH